MDDLNRSELETVRVLWEQGESKPSDIEAAFSWAIDNGTLRSVLRILMDKGLVTRRKVGKAFYYKAAKSRKAVLAHTARRMAQVFTGGSPAELIATLIKTEKLSRQDLDELRRIAADETISLKKSLKEIKS